MVSRLGPQAPFAYDRGQVLQECPERKAAYNQADKPRVTDVSVYGTSTSVAFFTAHTNGTRYELVKAEPYG
jgi:hypothetical protein